MVKLFDKNKTGTLIISYYRSGTHYLSDYIDLFLNHEEPESCYNFQEVETYEQLEELTSRDISKYKLAIVNSIHPKFFLLNNQELLSKWHVIRLTRKNKIDHFISSYFWKKKRVDMKLPFKHHCTKEQAYLDFINKTGKETYDEELVKIWITEQLLTYVTPCDVQIDYDELPLIDPNDYYLTWQPNKYGNLGLSDIFNNYQEIEKLLNNFCIV